MKHVRWSTPFLLVLPMVGCAASAEKRFVSQVLNKPAQNFELKALDGATVKLSDHRGKPVLLAFFAYG